jgi:hypothetical protein
VAVFAACSKVPQAEVDAAAASLAEAEAASSGVYATEAVAEAKAAVEAVNTEIAAQAEKFALFRSYDRTGELVATAEQAAMAAKSAAEAAEIQAEADATAALESLTASEASATALLTELGACKRKPKGFAADLENLGGTLSGFTAQRADVESAIASEDYLGASELAASIQAQVDGLILEMDQAKVKIGC